MSDKYEYAIFDARYTFDPDRATLCEFCESLDEAQVNRTDYGDDAVIVRFKLVGDELTEPKIMPNFGVKP